MRHKPKKTQVITEDGRIEWHEVWPLQRFEGPRRGPKIKGPKTHCPYCNTSWCSKAARAKHIQLAHRNRKPVLFPVAEGESNV